MKHKLGGFLNSLGFTWLTWRSWTINWEKNIVTSVQRTLWCPLTQFDISGAVCKKLAKVSIETRSPQTAKVSASPALNTW
ncbi:hypothetical protein F5Y17DRAFT_450324 [Xylariaceae sp. FL0594]|nr:hypothetical protein F5Y17DRAFT_450324 [Xylariaceae sp. FL0594]